MMLAQGKVGVTLETNAKTALSSFLDNFIQDDLGETPEEGMITLATASPWATRTSAWVFPSPAKDVKAYCAFVRRVVERTRGRVRFIQNETEPSDRFFWSGTAEEYAAQQKLFYRTVREVDPSAVVVLAGFNGLFDPTGVDPLPNEDANLAFLKGILESVSGAFDVFDIHLYADPYTIPARRGCTPDDACGRGGKAGDGRRVCGAGIFRVRSESALA
jgi:hypothetical protein